VTFSKKTGGAFAAITAPKRRSGGAWVDIQNGYRRASGAWTAIYTGIRVAITNQSPFSTGVTGTRNAGYKLTVAGAVQTSQGTTTTPAYTTRETWLVSGTASQYDVRMTKNSGNATPTGTLNTWLNLGTERTWEVQDAAADAVEQNATCTVEIRDATTLAVLDTASILFTADRG
jgi:hypothetical protein